MDKSSVIFGNKIDAKTLAKAQNSKQKFIKRFGDDSKTVYHLGLEPIKQIEEIKSRGTVEDKPTEVEIVSEEPPTPESIEDNFNDYIIKQ